MFGVYGRLLLILLLVPATFSYVWLARISLGRSLDMVFAKACYRTAEKELKAGRKQQAWRLYSRGAKLFAQSGEKPAIAIERGSEYLLGGNCQRRLGHMRMALGLYQKGLVFEPYSINLLTSAGFCAAKLGENNLALGMLERSQAIHALNPDARRLLRDLQSGS